jgi:hypothetical protein
MKKAEVKKSRATVPLTIIGEFKSIFKIALDHESGYQFDTLAISL